MKKAAAVILLIMMFVSCAASCEETEKDLPCSFHDFTGKMPYAFEDATTTDGTLSLVYNIDGRSFDDYVNMLLDSGYESYVFSEDEGFTYSVLSNTEYGNLLYAYYYEDYQTATFMFFSDMEYGFDPVNDLD